MPRTDVPSTGPLSCLRSKQLMNGLTDCMMYKDPEPY
jgi:hypothetical protein